MQEVFRHYVESLHPEYERLLAEPDPLRQALLEIYVSVVLRTPYNDFETH